MNKAIITVGISASGKSTFADEWLNAGPNRVRIERDLVRKALVEADGKEWSWDKWNWKRESEVTAIINRRIEACAGSHDIILSDTNLHTGRRNTLVKWLESLGYEVEVKMFPVSIEEAWKRDAKRANGVGHSVIAKQYEQNLENSTRRRYVADPNKPACILVDIDGTLAHMNGKRGAFEWEKVGLDVVDEAVRAIVNRFAFRDDGSTETDTVVIALSGRDGICEPETRQWLKDNDVGFHKLFMRAPNDMRKDTIVKEEIFWRDIADNYSVLFAIDDRPSVARMWRELGVKVFQVGNPHIEF